MNPRDELSDRQKSSDPELDTDHCDPEEPGDPPGGDPPDNDSGGDIYTDP